MTASTEPSPQEIIDAWHAMVDKATTLDAEDAAVQVLPGDMNKGYLPHDAIKVPIAAAMTWLPTITSGNPLAMRTDAEELRQVGSALTYNGDLMQEIGDKLVEWEGEAAERFATYRGKIGTALGVCEEGALELARCLEGYSVLLATARLDAYGVISDTMAALEHYEAENEITGIERVLDVFEAVATALDAVKSENPLMLASALSQIVAKTYKWVFGGNELQQLVDECADQLKAIHDYMVEVAPRFGEAFQQLVENFDAYTPPEVAAGAFADGTWDPNEFTLDDSEELQAVIDAGLVDMSPVVATPEGQTDDHA